MGKSPDACPRFSRQWLWRELESDKNSNLQFRGLVLSQLKLSQTSPTVLAWVFVSVRNDSPTIAKIWDTSGNKKRFLFFRFFPDHPRLSGKSIICVFHYSAKSGTVGKLRNPGSSEIFPIYDNWAKWKYLGNDDFSVTPSVRGCQI